ncbi:MAG TPA: alanine racemase [Candidatus Lumbricidophila sp.]|nr:alanine racemase [Candidatus Lumbricidophila sp.]
MSGDLREALIDLAAYRANIARVTALVSPSAVLAVVKADAYGHGMEQCARAALEAGATWLGTADRAEAQALRAAGITAPILCWLHAPGATFDAEVQADIDLGISSVEQLAAAAQAGHSVGRPARVHLKVETGLGRNGVAGYDWERVLLQAREAARAGAIVVVGIWSHLAGTSAEADAEQAAAFNSALALAASLGIDPELRHLAASGAALSEPELRYDLVRIGIAGYGLSPWAGERGVDEFGLTPVMTLRSKVAAVRRVEPGHGVSYGHTWRAEHPTGLALVPLGYADGIPRQASGRAEVWLAGQRMPVVGRIAMDQFVVETGDVPVEVGDEVVVFGDGSTGAPTAEDWAGWSDSIGYEIVTRLGPRVTRLAKGA